MELVLLSLLLIKHFLFDFVLQTDEHIKFKGVYGDRRGIDHSLQHAWGTVAILTVYIPSFFHIAFLIGIAECVLHYHIDYIKMKYFQYPATEKMFWIALGLDQLLHYLTYVLILFVYESI